MQQQLTSHFDGLSQEQVYENLMKICELKQSSSISFVAQSIIMKEYINARNKNILHLNYFRSYAKYFQGLRRLYISNNFISHIGDLMELADLEIIDLAFNQIKSIEINTDSNEKFIFQKLYRFICGYQVMNWGGYPIIYVLKTLKIINLPLLEELDASRNSNVYDFCLKDLPKLAKLEMEGLAKRNEQSQKMQEVKAQNEKDQIWSEGLKMKFSQLSFQTIRELDLSNSHLKSVNFLSDKLPLEKMKYLSLNGNRLKRLPEIQVPNLVYLNLTLNHLKSTSFLLSFKSRHLGQFNILGNNISSLEGLICQKCPSSDLQNLEIECQYEPALKWVEDSFVFQHKADQNLMNCLTNFTLQVPNKRLIQKRRSKIIAMVGSTKINDIIRQIDV